MQEKGKKILNEIKLKSKFSKLENTAKETLENIKKIIKTIPLKEDSLVEVEIQNQHSHVFVMTTQIFVVQFLQVNG